MTVDAALIEGMLAILGGLLGGGIGGFVALRVSNDEGRRAREDWVRDRRMETYERFRRAWKTQHDAIVKRTFNKLEGPLPYEGLDVEQLYALAEIDLALVGPPEVAEGAFDAVNKLDNATGTRSDNDKMDEAEAAFYQTARLMRDVLGFTHLESRRSR